MITPAENDVQPGRCLIPILHQIRTRYQVIFRHCKTIGARLVAPKHAHLRPYTPPTSNQRKLDRLILRRAKIIRIKSSLKLTMGSLSGFATELKTALLKLDALMAKIDATMSAIAAHSAQPVEAQQYLQTIVEAGPVVGMALVNTLERVPFRNADAFVVFIGYDPRANDSGHIIGRRRLSKRGPAKLRRLLFNAAMAAIKSKVWKTIYEHYHIQGWSTTATLVIIARKLPAQLGLSIIIIQPLAQKGLQKILDANHRILLAISLTNK